MRKALLTALADALVLSAVIGWTIGVMALQDLRTRGGLGEVNPFAPMVMPMTHLEAAGFLWVSFVTAIVAIYSAVRLRMK